MWVHFQLPPQHLLCQLLPNPKPSNKTLLGQACGHSTGTPLLAPPQAEVAPVSLSPALSPQQCPPCSTQHQDMELCAGAVSDQGVRPGSLFQFLSSCQWSCRGARSNPTFGTQPQGRLRGWCCSGLLLLLTPRLPQPCSPSQAGPLPHGAASLLFPGLVCLLHLLTRRSPAARLTHPAVWGTAQLGARHGPAAFCTLTCALLGSPVPRQAHLCPARLCHSPQPTTVCGRAPTSPWGHSSAGTARQRDPRCPPHPTCARMDGMSTTRSLTATSCGSRDPLKTSHSITGRSGGFKGPVWGPGLFQGWLFSALPEIPSLPAALPVPAGSSRSTAFPARPPAWIRRSGTPRAGASSPARSSA